MINEKEYREMIYAKAEKVQNKDDLDKLLTEIMEFGHDYGTIVYGCMAAMKAAFNVVNRAPSGGITGFQAGCLGWECVHEFMSIKAPCRIVDFNNMLYPQYADKFDKTISQETWDDIREKAKTNLEKENHHANSKVIEHWKRVAGGEIPFGYRVTEQ